MCCSSFHMAAFQVGLPGFPSLFQIQFQAKYCLQNSLWEAVSRQPHQRCRRLRWRSWRFQQLPGRCRCRRLGRRAPGRSLGAAPSRSVRAALRRRLPPRRRAMAAPTRSAQLPALSFPGPARLHTRPDGVCFRQCMRYLLLNQTICRILLFNTAAHWCMPACLKSTAASMHGKLS